MSQAADPATDRAAARSAEPPPALRRGAAACWSLGLGSLIALFMVQVLLFYSQPAFVEQGPPETIAGYYVASVAATLIVVGSLVLPHARRTRPVA